MEADPALPVAAHEVLQKAPPRVVLAGGRKRTAEDPSAAGLPDELVEGEGRRVHQGAAFV